MEEPKAAAETVMTESVQNTEQLPIRKPRTFEVFLMLDKVWANMTIEPAMFLMTFAWSLSGSTGSQLLIYKTCRIDFNQTDETCQNLFLKENQALNDDITDKVKNGYFFLTLMKSVLVEE